MVILRLPRESGLRRASGSFRPTRGCASSVCARGGSRRSQAAMEVDGAMSSPRRHQWRTAELGGGVRAHEAGGRGWFIYAQEVGWELVGHSCRSAHVRCGRQRPATCKHPGGQWRATGGTPTSAVSPHGAPAVVDVTHRSTPTWRSDQRVLQSLGVRARRGYGVYSNGRRGRARDVAVERARRSKVFSIC
jgi:hypothetical protein